MDIFYFYFFLAWKDGLTPLDAWKLIAEVPAEKNTRAIRLLDQRCFELKAAAHEHLMTLWNHLILVDFDSQVLTINRTLPCEFIVNIRYLELMLKAEPGTLDEAITGLKYFKELDQAALRLWQVLDKIALAPRTDLFLPVLPSITLTEVV